LSAIDSWRNRATLVSLELPLGTLSVTAARELLRPVFSDPMIESARTTPEGTVVLRGPGFLVARAIDLLAAAQLLLAK
jgi:hypothetical protein